MSETTQPVRLTGLIPNSHTPCRLNCLLGDRITSLLSSGSSLSNFCDDQKNLALDPCLLLPSPHGSKHPLPSVQSGYDRAAGLGPLVPGGSARLESGAGNRQEEAGDSPGMGGVLSSTISSFAHVSLSTQVLCCLLPSELAR